MAVPTEPPTHFKGATEYIELKKHTYIYTTQLLLVFFNRFCEYV